MTLDPAIRGQIYNALKDRGTPPSIAELTATLGVTSREVEDGLRRLAAGRQLVLQPASGEILMAPPFSAVPTPFRVTTTRHSSYANCIWDAFGVPVMLGAAATIATACGCCGEAMTLATDGRAVPGGGGLVHFAVPARHWWDDMVFT